MSSVVNLHLDTLKTRECLKNTLEERFKIFCTEWLLIEPILSVHFESTEVIPNIGQENQILNLNGRIEIMRCWLLQHIIADRLSGSLVQPQWLTNWLDQAVISLWQALTGNIVKADLIRIKILPTPKKLSSTVCLSFASEFGDFQLNILRDDIDWVEAAPAFTQEKSISLLQILSEEQFKCTCKLPDVEVPLSLLCGLTEGDVILFDHPATDNKVELHVSGHCIAECKFSANSEAALHVLRLTK